MFRAIDPLGSFRQLDGSMHKSDIFGGMKIHSFQLFGCLILDGHPFPSHPTAVSLTKAKLLVDSFAAHQWHWDLVGISGASKV